MENTTGWQMDRFGRNSRLAIRLAEAGYWVEEVFLPAQPGEEKKIDYLIVATEQPTGDLGK